MQDYDTIDEFTDQTLWDEICARKLLGKATVNIVNEDFFKRFGNIVDKIPPASTDVLLQELELRFNIKH